MDEMTSAHPQRRLEKLFLSSALNVEMKLTGLLVCGHLLARISGDLIGNISDLVVVVELCSPWRTTGAGVNISFGTSILVGLFLGRHAALRPSSSFVHVRGVFYLTVHSSTISSTDTQNVQQ